jgi:hypothetical protein
MISFSVVLTAQDWDAARSGWRCSPLRIPGAQITVVHAEGSRIDDRLYSVDAQHELVTWNGSDRHPSKLMLSIRLTQELSSDSRRQFWMNLAVVVPVICSIIAAGGGYLAGNRSEPMAAILAPGTYYEKWTVHGRVSIPHEQKGILNASSKIHHPPVVTLSPLGKFDAEIPVFIDERSQRQFPSLTIATAEEDGPQATIELESFVADHRLRRITVNEPIRLCRSAAASQAFVSASQACPAVR